MKPPIFLVSIICFNYTSHLDKFIMATGPVFYMIS